MSEIKTSRAIEGLRRLREKIDLAAHLTLAAVVAAAESNAKGTKLFKDGTSDPHTRDTIKGTVSGDTGQLVARGAAIFLENGTVAHTITARNGGMLRFVQNGEVVFRRSVRHPGTRGTHFMAIAAQHAARTVPYAAEIYVNEAIASA